MKDLLPFVTNEVGYSICASLKDDSLQTWLNELKRIKKVNPGIEQFIRLWSKMSKDKLHSLICGVCVYKLLESQAEADRMADEYKLG